MTDTAPQGSSSRRVGPRARGHVPADADPPVRGRRPAGGRSLALLHDQRRPRPLRLDRRDRALHRAAGSRDQRHVRALGGDRQPRPLHARRGGLRPFAALHRPDGAEGFARIDPAAPADREHARGVPPGRCRRGRVWRGRRQGDRPALRPGARRRARRARQRGGSRGHEPAGGARGARARVRAQRALHRAAAQERAGHGDRGARGPGRFDSRRPLLAARRREPAHPQTLRGRRGRSGRSRPGPQGPRGSSRPRATRWGRSATTSTKRPGSTTSGPGPSRRETSNRR